MAIFLSVVVIHNFNTATIYLKSERPTLLFIILPSLSNDISTLAELLLSYANFERGDKCKILQLTNTLACKYCSYSPITQIAGISYWYFKVHMKQKKSLKSICNNFLISQNSVHLYLNHYCVNNWNPL